MKIYALLAWAISVTPITLCATIKTTVQENADWVYYAPQKPYFEIDIENEASDAATVDYTLVYSTDKWCPIDSIHYEVSLKPFERRTLLFTFPVPEPGFYRCRLTAKADTTWLVKQFNIGYEPEKMISPIDAQPDLKTFWNKALADLANIKPQYKLTFLPDKSNEMRSTYLVEMFSLENEKIRGYLVTPVKQGKYRTTITYMGYGAKPWLPAPNDCPECVQFVLSVRGQALNEFTNRFGDWIQYGLQSKETYYYRGAFMDLVRAIDFVCTRPEVDQRFIFAEGGSQGGAFSMAAAALDNRLCGIAPTIPFLSDYPDYFQIVHWPAQAVLAKQKELGIADEELYRTLSYFDIKNLAPWIKCPVFMGVGLQDEVCPPHSNFAGYNQIQAEKQYVIYPDSGHEVPDVYYTQRELFMQTIIDRTIKKYQ